VRDSPIKYDYNQQIQRTIPREGVHKQALITPQRYYNDTNLSRDDSPRDLRDLINNNANISNNIPAVMNRNLSFSNNNANNNPTINVQKIPSISIVPAKKSPQTQFVNKRIRTPPK